MTAIPRPEAPPRLAMALRLAGLPLLLTGIAHALTRGRTLQGNGSL